MSFFFLLPTVIIFFFSKLSFYSLLSDGFLYIIQFLHCIQRETEAQVLVQNKYIRTFRPIEKGSVESTSWETLINTNCQLSPGSAVLLCWSIFHCLPIKGIFHYAMNLFVCLFSSISSTNGEKELSCYSILKTAVSRTLDIFSFYIQNRTSIISLLLHMFYRLSETYSTYSYKC